MENLKEILLVEIVHKRLINVLLKVSLGEGLEKGLGL